MSQAGLHTKADETASWWWQQLVNARGVYGEVCRSKGHFRDKLHACLDLRLPSLVIGNDPDADYGYNGNIEQMNIHYLARYMDWVESQAYDHHPEILYPRYASPDTTLGDMVSELLIRVGDEADEMEEWRGTIKDAGANGCFAVWYGVGVEASNPGMFFDTAKSVEEIAELAAAGVHIPREGQDHRLIAQILRDRAMGDGTEEGDIAVQELLLSPGGEQIQENLLRAAAEHDELYERERKKPNKPEERNTVWVERSPCGLKTLWDPLCCDNPTAKYPRGARWIAREIVMDIDDARNHPAFRPRIRTKIQSGAPLPDDHLTDSNVAKDDDFSKYKVSIWEVWDRKYRERHYITRGLNEFLEVDSANPHVDEHGKALIRNFFPCVIGTPRKTNQVTPHTPYGIPTMAIAWELQRLIVKLQSYSLDAVKKLSVRQFMYDDQVTDEDIQKLSSGETGVGVKMPTGWAQSNQGDPIRPISFGSVPGELFHEVKHAEQKLASVLAWPLSQMTGAPQADTATAEQISVQAGQSSMGYFIRCLEDAYARGQEIKRALVKHYYTDDQIGDLIGRDHLEDWAMWKASSLAGDRLQARFRMLGDPVRIKQVADVLAMIPTWVDQNTGLPLIPSSEYLRIIQELLRLQGLGKAEGAEYSDAMLMAGLRKQGMLGQGGAPGGNGQPGETPPKQSERDEKPATNQQMSAAVQRTGPKGGAGRGMSPTF